MTSAPIKANVIPVALFQGIEQLYDRDKNPIEKVKLHFLIEEVIQYPGGKILALPLDWVRNNIDNPDPDVPVSNKFFKVAKDDIKKDGKFAYLVGTEGVAYWLEYGQDKANNFQGEGGRQISYNSEILLKAIRGDDVKKRIQEIAQNLDRYKPQHQPAVSNG